MSFWDNDPKASPAALKSDVALAAEGVQTTLAAFERAEASAATRTSETARALVETLGSAFDGALALAKQDRTSSREAVETALATQAEQAKALVAQTEHLALRLAAAVGALKIAAPVVNVAPPDLSGFTTALAAAPPPPAPTVVVDLGAVAHAVDALGVLVERTLVAIKSLMDRPQPEAVDIERDAHGRAMRLVAVRAEVAAKVLRG